MTLHQANDIIAERYRIVTPLGKGGMGITYEAEDFTNYQRVAVKAVSLRQAEHWKILELFEREAKVIANLNHPQIPKYLNYFYIDTEQDRWFYLIRELVSGDSLATKVEKGWHPTEAEVKQVAIQILEILSYLHQLNPPIIHRDIKPENIILRPDGKIFLVDFGAVQDIYRQTISFSGTFVGTIGYMPPEQLRGKAYCASDLYSLGGTLLYLLTHRSPDELPQTRMKIDFRSCVEISPEFADWLEVILEPMWEDRFQSVTAALNVLTNNLERINSVSDVVKSSSQKNIKSRVNLAKTSSSLIIKIRPKDLKDSRESTFIILCWLILTLLNLAQGNILFALSCFIFVLLPLFLYIRVNNETDIQIYSNQFFIKSKILIFTQSIKGKVEDINKIYIEEDFKYRGCLKLELFQSKILYRFGFNLNRTEKEWLVAEINDFLEQLKLPTKLEKLEKKSLDISKNQK